jgi:transketolase
MKGKGVSFMEGENAYHGVAPSDDELTRALGELAG